MVGAKTRLVLGVGLTPGPLAARAAYPATTYIPGPFHQSKQWGLVCPHRSPPTVVLQIGCIMAKFKCLDFLSKRYCFEFGFETIQKPNALTMVVTVSAGCLVAVRERRAGGFAFPTEPGYLAMLYSWVSLMPLFKPPPPSRTFGCSHPQPKKKEAWVQSLATLTSAPLPTSSPSS